MDLEANYEIARVAEFILSRNFTRVALQFPDELLKDSMRVVKALRQELESHVKLYVMADTTYGSCCVDEVGAAHVNANCVVHYGHTCLSPTSTLPALFIFRKASVVTSNCARTLLDHGLKSGKPILVLYGLEYAHAISEIKKLSSSSASSAHGSTTILEHLYADANSSVISPCEECGVSNKCETETEETGQNYNFGGLSWRLPQGRKMEDYLLFWIGSEDTAFANVVLTFNSCEIGVRPRVYLLQHPIWYYLVEKAKDANMIGILVGTLGAAGYLDMINRMRKLITKAGKKSYTFVMGRPNPAKLANFPECDVFINVSCPQTALLDSKEFLAPIITPFEAMLALVRWLQQQHPMLTWSQLISELMEQFGGDLSAPPTQLLPALRQVGTMDEYCNEFHVRAAHISGIPSHIQLELFLNGLKEELRVRFRPNDATDLRIAMSEEVEYGFRGRQWTGEYIVEFRDLIASSPLAWEQQSDEARFSFIQGSYVEHLDLQDEEEKDEILALVNTTEKAVQLRSEDNKSVAKTGAEYLMSRSYQGLDISGTDSLPGKFFTGRSGKASGYKNENTR
ncbi:diphthamide biosynthesis protein 2 [Striga asiatica]|uniref:2-(3-amino-3-carboxypropyl)histidine synthase subunit 2 n=1 Tax=Striga asiatica TaxID=4170 RepID=A0A5A7RET4_STRAF|nr:diphthamide biosynthesis protein 2 [Striga asiatica]